MFQSMRPMGRVKGVRHPGLALMGAFFATVQLPALPDSQNWYSSVASWPMLRNDINSDCTIAAAGHIIQQESIYAGGPELLMTDDEALAGYRVVNPRFDPARPETDVGAYEGDVGQTWMQRGFQCGGQIDRIAAFGTIDPRNINELKYSVLLTGNAFLALMLPRLAEQDLSLWDIPTNRDDAEIIGGHAVPAVGWDKDHLFVVSWGRLVPCTWRFVAAYLDEAHATLSRRWINSRGLTPAGFEWDWLVAASRQFSTAA